MTGAWDFTEVGAEDVLRGECDEVAALDQAQAEALEIVREADCFFITALKYVEDDEPRAWSTFATNVEGAPSAVVAKLAFEHLNQLAHGGRS